MVENAKIVCLESSDVRLMMTELTILFQLKSIELALDQLVSSRKSTQSLHDSLISHSL